jgi:hypothetical protein
MNEPYNKTFDGRKWWVDQCGWGRPFSSEEKADDYIATMEALTGEFRYGRLAPRKLFRRNLYRTVAVTFRQVISEPPSHTRVPYLMDNLIYNINEDSWLAQRANADLYTKEFLDIHPFTDGNGRIGSLLWNFLRGSLHEPETMPYFYGENHG